MPTPDVFVPQLRKKEMLRLQKAVRSVSDLKFRDRSR